MFLKSLLYKHPFSYFRFENSQIPKNNLAILIIRPYIRTRFIQKIDICSEPPELGSVLGTCGLGSTSTIAYKPQTTNLQETFLYESVFKTHSGVRGQLQLELNLFNYKLCSFLFSFLGSLMSRFLKNYLLEQL